MAESNLITISDVQVYRRIDPKFNADRFGAFVMDIQRVNLRQLLGDALYLDFFANISDTKYSDLRVGKDYTYNSQTIHYYGLKPYLCYLWLSIAAREGDLFLTNYGTIQLNNNPQQAFERASERDRIAVQYIETATSYANDIVKFLNENAATYLLWVRSGESNKTNFISFRI